LAIIGTAGFLGMLISWAWSEGDHETDEQQTSHKLSFMGSIGLMCISAILAAGIWG